VLAYLDTSALVKLLVAEAETAALTAALEGADLVTSALARVELRRAVARHPDPEAPSRVDAALATLAQVSPGSELLDQAGRLEPASMRSLDAVHVATALMLGDRLDHLVTYDLRMADAARSHGLAVRAPGR